ncbi:hypothetical protein D3C74_245510 [compost metagenome]
MISITAARETKDISLEDASRQLGISVETLRFFEKNPSEINISDAVMLTSLYKVEINSVRFF